MDATAEQLRTLAEPWAGGEKIKQVIDRAARRAGLSYWRAFDIWYGKARQIREFERHAIADALERKRLQEARRELHDLRIMLERCEARLTQIDPDFHRPAIDQMRALGGPRRAVDRTGD